LLNMIHRQQIALYANVLHLLIGAILIYKLGSDYGAIGVVIAVSISVALRNLVFYALARIYIDSASKEWNALKSEGDTVDG